MAAPVSLHLEFGGGAELLFDGVKDHHVTLPDQSQPWDMKQLLVWIRANMLKERPELFVQGDTVIANQMQANVSCLIHLKNVVAYVLLGGGILVLINDADWELMGELSYELQDRDNVVFISTLHGG